MDKNEILSKVDHTLLNVTATWKEVKQICDDAISYHTASVCIPPSYVKQAYAYLKDKIKICTVIGFPNGYQTTAVKAFETKEAITNGASEIDMVINLGWVKDKKFDLIEKEIHMIKEMCQEKILKVIIETCLLLEEEKIKMCEIVTRAGVEYIKTSTGFSTYGATPEDIKLLSEHIGKNVKVKAAGGIASFEDAEELLRLGASRLGTSRLVSLAKSKDFR